MKQKTTTKQIDGDHYVKKGIQPWEVIERAKMDYWEGAATKYIMRWKDKDGLIDLDKAIHYIEHIKERALRGCYGEKYLDKRRRNTHKTR